MIESFTAQSQFDNQFDPRIVKTAVMPARRLVSFITHNLYPDDFENVLGTGHDIGFIMRADFYMYSDRFLVPWENGAGLSINDRLVCTPWEFFISESICAANVVMDIYKPRNELKISWVDRNPPTPPPFYYVYISFILTYIAKKDYQPRMQIS